MTDQTNSQPWAQIRSVARHRFVVVHVERMLPGGAAPLISAVAENLALTPDEVLSSILTRPQNQAAVRAMYRDLAARNVVSGNARGLGGMRREMRRAAYVATGAQVGGQIVFYEAPFAAANGDIGWGVRAENNAALVFPLKPAFERTLQRANEARARQILITSLRPTFDALDQQLDVIGSKLRLAAEARAGFQQMNERNLRALGILGALEFELSIMGDAPKEAIDPDDRREVEAVKTALTELKRETTRALITQPTSAPLATQIEFRDRTARELLQAIENNAFADAIQAATSNWELAPFTLQNRLEETLVAVARELMQSEQGEVFLDRHVLPMVQMLGTANLAEEIALITAGPREYIDALTQVTGAPTGVRSCYVLMAAIAITPQAVGNGPGPAAFAVAVVDAAGPALLGRVMRNPAAAKTMSGRLLRAVLAVTRPGPIRARTISGAIISQRYGDIERLDWTGTFMKGTRMMSLISVCSIAAFALAVTADDANTLRGWSDILASGTGSVLAVAAALNNFSRLSNTRVIGFLATSPLANALGIVGGLFATVSGVESARAEANRGDTTGAWILGIGAAGSAGITIGAAMMAMGLASEATVVGVPVGLALQLAGGALAIGATAVAAVRDLLTPGTEKVFEAGLDAFAADGPVAFALTVRPALANALARTRTAQNDASFWDISLRNGGQILADTRCFALAEIAMMTDEEEDTVRGAVRFRDTP